MVGGKIKLAGFIAALLLFSNAYAEQGEGMGGFGGFSGGITGFPKYMDQANAAAVAGTTNTYAQTTEHPVGYDFNAYGGYWATENLGVEVGAKFMTGSSGTSDLYNSATGFLMSEGTYSTSASSFYGAVDLRMGADSEFVLKIGMHQTSVSLSSSGIPLTNGSQSASVSSKGMLVGFRVDVGPHATLGMDFLNGVSTPNLAWPNLNTNDPKKYSIFDFTIGYRF